MIILGIRTDRPEAELALYDSDKSLEHKTWLAHRQLAEAIHAEIKSLLDRHNKELLDIEGIVAYQGPGSFTGLRIGLSVANALAYANKIPIVGVTGNEWQATGVDELLAGNGQEQVMPEYGAEPHITQQKK